MSRAALRLAPAAERELADLRRVHFGMLDSVLAGGGIAGVAGLAADALGGTVVVALPAFGLAVSAPDPDDPRAAVVRRHVEDADAPRPRDLAEQAPVRGDGDVLGAVVLLGGPPGRAAAAREVLELAALAVRAAARLEPEETRRSGTAAARLFSDLRAQPPPSAQDVLARARQAGAELATGAVAVCAALEPSAGAAARGVVLQDAPDAVADVHGERLDALVPAGAPVARRIAARLALRGPVGMSHFEPDPGNLHRALREAEIVLALTSRGTVDLDTALSAGWRLLTRIAAIDPAEVEELAAGLLGPLLDAEPANERLLETLRTYLDTGANMNATALAGYTHRHTVAYRLERIHELTQHDPKRLAGQEPLSLGLKALAVRDATF